MAYPWQKHLRRRRQDYAQSAGTSADVAGSYAHTDWKKKKTMREMRRNGIPLHAQIERLSMRYGSRSARPRQGFFFLTGPEIIAALDSLDPRQSSLIGG